MSRRVRCQCRNPVARLPASSLSRGFGSGPRWGSDKCASTNISSSCPPLCRASPSSLPYAAKTWMAGTSPAMTADRLRVHASGTADQDSGEKYQRPANHDLERRRQERRVHEAVADVGNCGELDGDDDRRNDG